MTEDARKSCANAHLARPHLGCLGLLLCLAAPAQTPPGDEEPPWLQPLLAEARQMLDHPTPELRGEAALILASSGQQGHHNAILKVARDSHPEAHNRGLLALGILGAPGAEALLGEMLLDSQVGPESVVAALGLGLLKDVHPANAGDEYLMYFRRSNYRRQRDVLASLLTGFTVDVRYTKATALRALLEDESNRDAPLRALMIEVLMPVPEGLDTGEIEGLLRSTAEEERRAVLLSLVSSQRRLPAENLERVERLATRDRSPKVRAAALEYLTFHRHLPALDLSAKALSSEHPVEVSAAVRGAVTLGGGAMAAALETRILEESDPVLQAAMLAAFTGYRSEEFKEGCASLAIDRSRPLPVRAHAAVIAVAMGHDRMAPTLRGLFLDAQDPEILTLVTTALVRVAPDEPPLTDLYPPSSPEDLSRLDDRLRALVAAGQPAAFDLLRDALANDDLDPVTKADLLRAWRLGAWSLLPPEHVEQLPPFLAALLR